MVANQHEGWDIPFRGKHAHQVVEGLNRERATHVPEVSKEGNAGGTLRRGGMHVPQDLHADWEGAGADVKVAEDDPARGRSFPNRASRRPALEVNGDCAITIWGGMRRVGCLGGHSRCCPSWTGNHVVFYAKKSLKQPWELIVLQAGHSFGAKEHRTNKRLASGRR